MIAIFGHIENENKNHVFSTRLFSEDFLKELSESGKVKYYGFGIYNIFLPSGEKFECFLPEEDDSNFKEIETMEEFYEFQENNRQLCLQKGRLTE